VVTGLVVVGRVVAVLNLATGLDPSQMGEARSS
jgi:hypothetical protein